MQVLESEENIQVVAATLANCRLKRNGSPSISNVLDILPKQHLDEVTEDAIEALKALDKQLGN